MAEIASFTSLYPIVGIPALFILVYFIARKAMEDLKLKNDEDRSEHLKKWNSMIDALKQQNSELVNSHEKEMDRILKIIERTALAQEMQTANIAKINEKLNGLCQLMSKGGIQ